MAIKSIFQSKPQSKKTLFNPSGALTIFGLVSWLISLAFQFSNQRTCFLSPLLDIPLRQGPQSDGRPRERGDRAVPDARQGYQARRQARP